MPENKLIIDLRLGHKSDARKVIRVRRRAVHEIASGAGQTCKNKNASKQKENY